MSPDDQGTSDGQYSSIPISSMRHGGADEHWEWGMHCLRSSAWRLRQSGGKGKTVTYACVLVGVFGSTATVNVSRELVSQLTRSAYILKHEFMFENRFETAFEL
jgi:hypothetical protein